MRELAASRGHVGVVTLASVVRLQTLIQMGVWDEVREALSEVESSFLYPSALSENAATFAREAREAWESALLVYTLTLGIIFYTYVGETPSVEGRTKVLHEMLDGGVLDKFKYGVIEVRWILL